MSTLHDLAVWRCHITLAKFWGDWRPGAEPYDVREFDGNMLLYGGTSNLWEYAIGNGVATAGQTLAYLSTANAAIGVGDGTALAAAAQTDLQGANKLRVGMNAGYPSHTPGTAAANRTISFRSTFDTSQANWSWQECGVFNSATLGAGRMLNRKVQDMGTKTAASSFQITIDISID